MESAINLTNEQKQELINNLIEAFNSIIEAVEKVYNAIREVFVKMWKSLKWIIEKNSKIRKYISIYNRTHNRRIKNKQIKLIRKVLLE